jgi:hypothetical protein
MIMLYIALLFIASVGYSVIRYAAFAPENVANLPVFVVNKGISMGAALCFTGAFFQQWRQARGRLVAVEPRTWFRTGVMMAVAHILMSLAILRPAYFREFFDGERLSFGGEAVFLFGALTAGGIYLLHRSGWTERIRWYLSLSTMCLLFGHVLSMGLLRGLNINISHAYLPPMWLLSLIGIIAGILWLLCTRPDWNEAPGGGESAAGRAKAHPSAPRA